MQRCRTVSRLISLLDNKQNAVLVVYDILDNIHDKEGAYLNLGGGAHCFVNRLGWQKIRDHIKNIDGIYCKDDKKFNKFYR